MKSMDKWLGVKKNFIVLIISIILIYAVISVFFICKNLRKEKTNYIPETESLEIAAANIKIEKETVVNVDIRKNINNRSSSNGSAMSDDILSNDDNYNSKNVKNVDGRKKTIEELATEVIDNGINGEEREKYLGSRYEEVQTWIDENYIPPSLIYEDVLVYDDQIYYESYLYPTGDVLTPDSGINYYNGVLETYYNLDMSGVVDWMHSLGYEGEYWVRDDGVKMFGDYVMVAADYGYEPKGTITETSLGLGIVCDTGLGGWAWHDIAVAW